MSQTTAKARSGEGVNERLPFHAISLGRYSWCVQWLGDTWKVFRSVRAEGDAREMADLLNNAYQLGLKRTANAQAGGA
jgi:hypothetical protein